jgi:hypothetical protein
MKLLPALALFGLITPMARAEPWVFKHDQFPPDLSAAASAINGGQFYVQPGFVDGEAFGQIYTPLPEMFPLQITGFDLVLAAPPYGAEGLFANASIEIYNSESNSADPGNAPIFSITTGDLLNPKTQQFGFPLQGGVGLHVDFGQANAEDRPPAITSGKIWLVIRMNDPARDMSAEWGTLQCSVIDLGGISIGCGCQNVGTVHDASIVPKVNVLHHVTPLGACSGSKQWSYMENISNGTFAINGDIILRLLADVASTPCIPDCDGLQCGDNGCGGVCGTCANGRFCVDGSCVTCQPNCLSRQCGEDGCGGSCGACEADEVCGPDHFCEARCTPDCAGKTCGEDGCGGTCGTCDGTCVAGRCETACAPNCAGKTCGPDGCGGTCGTCNGACVDGQCEACTPNCDGKTCGPDGCGGSCGTCSGACVDGQCEACTPACDGKTCGEDGCGGSCGTCDTGTCDAGMCVGGLDILDVSPDFGTTTAPTPVSITGRGFAAGARVKLGASDLADVTLTGQALLEATVPAGLAPGLYTLIVVNPDGGLAQRVDAFEVRAPVGGTTDTGCQGGALSALGLLALLLRRRR